GDGCYALYFSQSLCEKAYQVIDDGSGTVASCFFDPNYQECRPCAEYDLYTGACQNTCPVCDGDSGRTVFAGENYSYGCDRFSGNQSSCEGAFIMGNSGVAQSCYFNQYGDCVQC